MKVNADNKTETNLNQHSFFLYISMFGKFKYQNFGRPVELSFSKQLRVYFAEWQQKSL
jgi:hypothetical protein